MHPRTAFLMRLKNGTLYELDEAGAVLWRSDGPPGWDYSGKWLITGFKTRHNANATITLAEAADGIDTGQGWVCDLDHGHHRMWASPSDRRLASLTRIVPELYYDPPEDLAATVFDPHDATFGPIMAAIQDGAFRTASTLLARLR